MELVVNKTDVLAGPNCVELIGRNLVRLRTTHSQLWNLCSRKRDNYRMKRFVVLEAGKLSQREQEEEMGWYRNFAV
jgi:hypothetical protein